MDATYQAQLRELNELNHQRFRAEIGAVSAKVDALAVRVSALEERLTSVEVALRSLGPELSEKLIKWMFGFFTATILTIGGLIIGLYTALQ